MNSLEKQNPSKRPEQHEIFIQNFEANLLNLNELKKIDLIMKQLQYLGTHFDPFNPEISTECQKIMDSLGLSEHFKNPYLATNILLRLLDKTEERLNTIKQ